MIKLTHALLAPSARNGPRAARRVVTHGWGATDRFGNAREPHRVPSATAGIGLLRASST